jgi:predicted MFS family arabinose efflux permease
VAIETTPNRALTGIAGAYAFFATLYFVQSVGDPTSGLIAQPVRSLLRAWGESPAELAAIMALLAVPWTIKPIFGLLSDFVPLFGSRRRNYLLLANAMAAVSLLLLAFAPLSPGNRWVMFALLLPTTMAIALGDVIVDALMVERGQPLGLTGRFQSIQWAAANAALLLTGVLGGFVAEERLQTLAFGGCAALWLFALVVTWLYASDEHGENLDSRSLRETGAALLGAFRNPLFLAVCALLTLWSFNPLWGSVLYVHMTEDLGFSEQQFGNVTSAFFLGSLLGSIGYGIYCRSVRLSTLLHISIIAAVISNAVYWQLEGLTSAYIVSVIAGFAYMTGTLIQLDLTARIIPARAAATIFATVMALTNFASSASEAFGGWLFEAAKAPYGRATAFSLVVAASVAAAISCWLVVPALRRAAPHWWDYRARAAKG